MKQAEEKEIKYPVGIQNFSKLREGGYMYVDKTRIIYELIRNSGYYFLSRPRRFGKSLMLSTLEAYYQGRRDLFKGLALESLAENWEPCPVLHLDLNNGNYRDVEDLENVLDYHLRGWEKEYDIPASDAEQWSLPLRFATVIRRAFEMSGSRVAILVDEYDKPMLNAVGDETLAENFRSILKAFYSNLKTMDRYIRIGVMTGVARFSKISIFSDLNNLRDISFEDVFSSICGITSDELTSYFADGIQALAMKYGKSAEEIHKDLAVNYDGYHFSINSPGIYNPFSLMNVFASSEIRSYWFESGTPSFLLKLVGRSGRKLEDISNVEIGESTLVSAGITTTDPIPALYQSGYLTIKGYDPEFKIITLGYPNREVKEGFLKFLLPHYVNMEDSDNAMYIHRFVMDVRNGDPRAFMHRLAGLVACVPYSEKGSAEAHFQNVCYLIFTLMGYFTRMEQRTSDGRIDLTVETDKYVYIFEFKTNSTASAAIDQIFRRQYWLPYVHSGKKIFLIGANFNTKTRRISEYEIKTP
ncbi:MAG: ATP-binding protein [Muribaculaceae bacterium]|nr:ATP-binding protein [Muribaculaceae bacterium]